MILTRLQAIVNNNNQNLEQDLINLFRSCLMSRVLQSPIGLGKVVKIDGTTFKDLSVTISYPTGIRRFDLATLFSGTNAMARICDYATCTAYKKALAALHECETALSDEELLRLQRAKELASEFESFLTTEFPVREDAEFFKALGWLTKLISGVYVVLPECLEETFVDRFGADATYKVTEKFANRWSFKINLRKHSETPEVIAEYFNASGRDIVNTSFILELVTNYGFKFAKQQNADAILEQIPEAFQESFITGLAE